jgi:hypothetical protein
MTADDAVDRGLTCREAIGLFGEFLEATLTQAQLAELDRHLAGCEPCKAYLNTYRRTRELTAGAERVEMPPEMRSRLAEFLLRRLSSGQGGEGKS